jgi:hypothetical protein
MATQTHLVFSCLPALANIIIMNPFASLFFPFNTPFGREGSHRISSALRPHHWGRSTEPCFPFQIA